MYTDIKLRKLKGAAQVGIGTKMFSAKTDVENNLAEKSLKVWNRKN